MDDQELAKVYIRMGFNLDTSREAMERSITQEHQSALTSGKRNVVDKWFEPNALKEQIDSAASISDLPDSREISSLEFNKHNSRLEDMRQSKIGDFIDAIDEISSIKDLPSPTAETISIIASRQRELADDLERELISRGILSGSALERELDALRTTSKGRQLAGGIKGRLRKIEKIREGELE